jgi:hypothetical protein
VEDPTLVDTGNMTSLINLLEEIALEEAKRKRKRKTNKVKRDRCLRIADRKFDKPSAYKSGAVVRCRQGKIWKGLKETDDPQSGKAAPYGSGYSKLKETIRDIIREDESLRKWFSRQGSSGKEGGWVDCNTCRKDPKTGRKKCKPCGRKEGEKRSKYPSCRPTPSQCSQPGKGKKWGKTK